MSKRNEDNIERFFRKALAQQDTTFRESDWQKMEKMLDQKESEKAGIRSANFRRAAYSLIGLLALISVSIYFLTFDGKASLSTEEVLPKQMQVAAGEEAPLMEKKGYPAAGLHSSPQPERATDEAAAGKNAVKTDHTTAEDLTLTPEKEDIAKQNEAAQAGAIKAKDTPEDKNSRIKRNAAADKARPEERREPTPSAQQKRQNAGAGNQQQKPAGFRDTPATAGTAANSISKNIQPSRNNGDQPDQPGKGLVQASPVLKNTSGAEGLEKHKDTTGKTLVVADDISKMPVHENSLPSLKAVDKDTERSAGPDVLIPQANTLQKEERTTLKKETTGATLAGGQQERVSPPNGQPSFKGDDKKTESVADPAARMPQANTFQQEGNTNTTLKKETAGALLAEKQDQEKALPQQQPGKDKTVEEAVEETSLPVPEPGVVPTRWSVAAVLAPDFSSTGLDRYTTPGEAYGLTVGYSVLRRFTVSTGVVRSTKKYVGYGSDYQPPKGYWQHRTNGIVPDDIRGTCAIVEIPLLVQYTLKQKEKWRVYFAAGVSSYIMMHEAYKYTFETPNPGAAKGWSTSKSSTYPFAIGHLSAAYENQLSQRWALGLEPFLKIPFAGVGWSKVNLYSTGIFINLRYRLFRKQQFVVPEERKTTTQ